MRVELDVHVEKRADNSGEGSALGYTALLVIFFVSCALFAVAAAKVCDRNPGQCAEIMRGPR